MDGITNIGWAYLNPNILADSHWRIAGCADFNGDGKPDLLWESNNGEHTVWYMNGVMNINWSYLTPNIAAGPQWRIVLH